MAVLMSVTLPVKTMLTQACTSLLQTWHHKGRGDKINPQPVMEVFVKKTKLDESTSGREPGLKCLLYEA